MKQTRNYTEEETKVLLENYQAAPTYEEQQIAIRELAKKLNKPEASIRSKLVKMKVYKSPVRTSAVTGKKPKTKLQLVEELEELTRLNLDGLDKTPKLTLDRLADYIKEKCDNDNN